MIWFEFTSRWKDCHTHLYYYPKVVELKLNAFVFEAKSNKSALLRVTLTRLRVALFFGQQNLRQAGQEMFIKQTHQLKLK